MAQAGTEGLKGRRKAILGWCLYDWAMSAFNTVIGTFVFSRYFTDAVAGDPAQGTQQWGMALGISSIIVAILSPVVGAIGDRGGRAKPWLAVLTTVCVLATAALYWVRPDAAYIPLALLAMAVASTAFELSYVFYNALLPVAAPPGYAGRVSGWGWGLGYFGGLGSLILCLVLLVQTDAPLFGLIGKEEAEHVRATALLVAVWYALFAIPLFLLAPDRPSVDKPAGRIVREGLAALADTVRHVRSYGNTVRYLIASALWRDGISTITAFGGIMAGSLFGMDTAQIILFAIMLNVAAGTGAVGFAWVDDRFGAKPTLIISILGLMVSATALLLVGTSYWSWAPMLALPLDWTQEQQWLLLFGLVLGIFFGPAQAAARTMVVRISPPGMETELFGLYNLTGRAVGMIGPFAYGAATAYWDSQRAGMSTVLVLFTAGLLLLLTVKEPARRGEAA